jgi:predicted RNA-binding Zn-ribbon protein involved in translation (DUF1610 family)
MDGVTSYIDNYKCPKCKWAGAPKEGLALMQTWTTGMPDFIGDPNPDDNRCQTMSPGGPGRLVSCLKCPECGYSVTRGGAE